ncbi:MAG TPA: hypothetical protein PKK12_10910 [Candidatus Aminicenantes bacterium]|nr:hypothetical protein [Candidatus Aminicenantes bacterium]
MNHPRRWIACWVVLSFCFLLGVTSAPLSAAPRPEKSEVAAAAPDSGTNCIETERDEGSYHKKKSSLPLILGIVGVGALAAVLIMILAKTKYDITGRWTMTMISTSSGAENVTWSVQFTGDKKSGDFQFENFYDGAGTYRVDGKNVTMSSTYYSSWNWTGKFTDKERMEGTSTWNTGSETLTWSWTASKGASASAVPAASSMKTRAIR